MPTPSTPTNFKELLILIEKDFESIRRKLLDTLQSDPGHDIGDSCDAWELLRNQITESELDWLTEVSSTLNNILELPENTVITILVEAAKMTDEQVKASYIEFKGDAGATPYSGFGF